MKTKLSVFAVLFSLANGAVQAATPIDLSKQANDYLMKQTAVKGQVEYHVYRQQVDFNGTTHTRIQQVYQGIPVWDATGVMHQPKAKNAAHLTATMNGRVYEALAKDLAGTPVETLSTTAKTNALSLSKAKYQISLSAAHAITRDESSEPIVFVDDHEIAHYAYLTSFTYDDMVTGEHKQMSIVDASTHQIYRSWNAVLTEDEDGYPTMVGGVGGNVKTGEVFYDGQQGHRPALAVEGRDVESEHSPGKITKFTECALTNEDISVQDVSFDGQVVYDVCSINQSADGIHWLSVNKGATRWNADEINGAYSPSLDAFYAATVIKQFYHDWYDVPALIDDNGDPMRFIMRVHYGRHFDNAFWDGRVMTFGDGGPLFYPLTSISVAAHEISHGFTDTHSHIDYFQPQMGALHESFSDMAAVTIENYMTGSNHWEIGREIKKDEGALRYLDDPTKDGQSIANMSDYDSSDVGDPHHIGGITNKAFYLLATTHGWTTRKAFNVMLQANMHYWTSSMTTFAEAACDVIQATKDYRYNVADVRIAFGKVGIMTDKC